MRSAILRNLPGLDDIIGTELWLKADRKKTYIVDGVNRIHRKVHLAPTHEGGGKTWKKLSNLWRDYERVRAMAVGSTANIRTGDAPVPKEVVEPKKKVEDEEEVMSQEDMAKILGEA